MVGKIWTALYFLVAYQGMCAGQVLRQDMVDLLVGQLADDVEIENAEVTVSELVKIFRKVGDDTKSLTGEIATMLKKLKEKSRRRILPVGVIHLLKAKRVHQIDIFEAI